MKHFVRDTLFTLLLISIVDGTDIDKGSNCYQGICVPKDYDRNTPPRAKKGPFKIFFNIERSQSSSVKKVDDHQMSIDYEPQLMMAWEDPRFGHGHFSILPFSFELGKYPWPPRT